jgi:hypothetical protein
MIACSGNKKAKQPEKMVKCDTVLVEPEKKE